jgi:hypothetical protein
MAIFNSYVSLPEGKFAKASQVIHGMRKNHQKKVMEEHLTMMHLFAQWMIIRASPFVKSPAWPILVWPLQTPGNSKISSNLWSLRIP